MSNYNRKLAHIILQKNNHPIYGGTINDKSITRYLEELNNKGYLIMFYPMLLIDSYEKPWRGRMYVNDAKDIENFFDGENGYNKFILHYAKLVKGKVKAFLIGSEMVELTKFKTSDNKFLVVDKLIDLAKQVRGILGKNVMISYAADWSEYHHTDGEWYFLDKLWASEYIDFIGIDAYFPLTSNDKTTYDINEIIGGWESGEGYDYYIDGNGKKQPLGKEYVWKNIKWWWDNKHYNPDGRQTEWTPKSKKIWFTELGFPSIDCATNQPNVFYDPSTAESNIPKYSKGQVDFQAQKLGLLATEMKWKDSEMIENKFVWAWDARPYPYFPDKLDVWGDGDCWKNGHWVQGKFFHTNLNCILFDICKRLNLDQIDTSQINHDVIGFCIHDNSTAKEVIDDLSTLYSFKVQELEDQLVYIPNKNREVNYIDSGDIVINLDKLESSLSIIKLGDENIISNVKLNYILFDQDYILTNTNAKNYLLDNDNQLQISLPIIITQSEVDEMAGKVLDDFTTNDIIVSLTLPITYAFLKVNDLVQIEYEDQILILQIFQIIIDETFTISIICERAD